MLKLTLITTTLLLFLGCTPEPKVINLTTKKPQAVTSQNILNIPIHIRDNGYNNFSTKIFNSKSELNRFLDTINAQSGWNKKNNFFYTLKKQEIDFGRDKLLIYRFSEPSSSIVLATDVPTEIDQHITVKIGKKKNSDMMTTDMAYYALAYTINKQTKDVTFDDGEHNETIQINTPQQR